MRRGRGSAAFSKLVPQVGLALGLSLVALACGSPHRRASFFEREAGARAMAEEPAAANAGAPVQHVVLLWLRDPGNPRHLEDLAVASRMLAALPGVLGLEMGPPLPSDRAVVEDGFDLALFFRFEDADALAAYQSHPWHRRAVEEVLAPLVERQMVVDVVLRR